MCMLLNSTLTMNSTTITDYIFKLEKENSKLKKEKVAITLNEAAEFCDYDFQESRIKIEKLEKENSRLRARLEDSDSDTEEVFSYNVELADALEMVAFLEKDTYKRDAYIKASYAVYNLPFEVKSGHELSKGPKKVEGIGKGIGKKIDELIGIFSQVKNPR